MPSVSVCLQVDFSLSHLTGQEFEKHYQSFVKPVLSALYANPKFQASLFFDGPELEWVNNRHPEALKLISELITRHQCEVLGGGFYNPVFPLLLPVDRSGQIEKLSSLLTSCTGKRPRGMNIPGSIWDSSLVTTLQSCNMEYIHLDQSLIPSGKAKFLPVITGEQGKTIKILPLYREFIPKQDADLSDWKQDILSSAKKTQDAVISIPFSAQEFCELVKNPTFKAVLEESDALSFTTPQSYLKTALSFTVSYVPAGMSQTIADWAQEPYKKCRNKTGFALTVYDFLYTYPQNRRLYERMMYISLLISQYHGDKARRQVAREKLWQAQSIFSYVSVKSGLPASSSFLQEAYSLLNEAGDILSEEGKKESLTKFDYNADGLNEYVYSMEKYSAVISPKAGTVTELNIKKGGGNYAANLSRMQAFDDADDDYQRGIFVEHLFEEGEYKKYLSLKPAGNGIFSRVRFTEKKFDAKRHEVQMEGRGEYSSLKLPVLLRKKFTASSGGITVQYILKNESPLALKAFFVVESNFSQMVFAPNVTKEYEGEIIQSAKREPLNLGKAVTYEGGVQTLLLTNTANKISFVVEPNEDSGFALLPVEFKRPSLSEEEMFLSTAYCASFFWEVDLAAGMEMEKTVSISFVSAKKRAKK